ncbi:major facilitator superfamily domain-containing protein [Cercophora newfieldiana]|uniref:Major facilitator superfamily domain-containing protein n=1 Tax=Cercophora newfieldiana TaxID=92897 RepID=A0AA39YF47_9PEZI|nr:major facilitator superfamily domain-containing protein [Cercophora newfieldiana]
MSTQAQPSTQVGSQDPAPSLRNDNVYNGDPEKTADITDTATDEEAAAVRADDSAQTTPEQQRWNQSPTNIFRFLTCVFAFILLGMSDAVVGALIPYIETYYEISYTIVSLLFLSPFVGYLLAALLNNYIHHYLGQRGIAVLGPVCRLIGFIPLACHPPYPALPIVMLVTGFGNGIEDSAWNAWIGNMHQANELLGLLHGAYGLGATISPLIATSMVTKGALPWYTFFYLQIGLDGLCLVLMTVAFWRATAQVHRDQYTTANNGKRTTTRHVLREPITWLLALFLLGYVGAEVSLGGWIVTFMLRVRHAEPFIAGLSATFFWLGLTVGRVLLGFITGRIGEKLAITGYLLLSVALQVLYWVVPNFVASAVFVAFLGFFLGPLFPAVIVAATKLLPPDYHVSAIGFAAAFGGGGAAIFPFAVGAIAQSKGVQVLQPVVLAILVFILLMWWFLPGGLRRGGLERARENKEKPGHEVMVAVRKLRGKSG